MRVALQAGGCGGQSRGAPRPGRLRQRPPAGRRGAWPDRPRRPRQLGSPHLRAVPHRWLSVRCLHHPRVSRCRMLLPMSTSKAGSPAEQSPRGQPPDGDHPHDSQCQHFQGLILSSVQHRCQLQFQCELGGPGSPDEITDQLLLARGNHEQCVCQHAHKFLSTQLSAGHPDRTPPRAVPAYSICRLCRTA